MLVFFFFQAEDGIRDYKVTGVQTCALPISLSEHRFLADEAAGLLEIKGETQADLVRHVGIVDVVAVVAAALFHAQTRERLESGGHESEFAPRCDGKIGRANV